MVGGCVRDSLLGREPKDWDITTSARPEQVKAVFAHTIDTGIEHGTVTVMIAKKVMKLRRTVLTESMRTASSERSPVYQSAFRGFKASRFYD